MHLLVSMMVGLLAFWQPQAAPSPIPYGLWVWSAEAEEASVSLSLQQDGDAWAASVNGTVVAATEQDGAVTFVLPDGRWFEAEPTRASVMPGYWHQPSSRLAYSDMVTPVSLAKTGIDTWEAEFSQQPRPFRMFLDVFDDEEGTPTAVLRNPERNEILALSFSVETDGDGEWALVSGSGESRASRSLTAQGEGLLLEHDWFDEPLLMQPATQGTNKGYYSRTEGKKAPGYEPPLDPGDGWEVVSAEEAGFDTARLDALVEALAETDQRTRRPDLIHAVLAAHKGKLVLEEYFHGHDAGTVHDTRSLGKLFAPTLIGALLQKGVAIDAEVRPIHDVFAAVGEELDDPRKADITLAHLMTFTSGLDCDIGNEDSMWSQSEEKNFWLFTSRLPVRHEPGERYHYCSGDMNLVGSAIQKAGEKPIIDLFDELIAQPLDFGTYHWNLTPNGTAYLGGGPYMRPRDILKIGILFAEDGVWNGKQVLDPDWVEEATLSKIAISPETTGLTPEEFSNNYFGGEQAYHWRVDTVRSGDEAYRSFEATGNGGQVLVVVPDLELTVLFMGGNYGQGGVWGQWRNKYVGGHIIPAMLDKSAP